MLSLQDEYSKLKSEYESYQKMAENIIQKQSAKIIELDKKLNRMSLIVEISEYINESLGNSKITSMINDIMIGILGVTYSSVYLLQNGKLQLKASNLKYTEHHSVIKDFNIKKSKLETCLLNSNSNICTHLDVEIHSSIFMPIYLKDNILGAIIVEHNIYNYLTEEHVKLLTTLSNHIAICLENNNLYNKIKENSRKDGLTGLYNRKYFLSIIKRRIKNTSKKFAIVMIDIDDFKKYNDTFGHQYGDYALKKISDNIKENVKKEDVVARYGGEEIIAFIDDIKKVEDVYFMMDHIRKIIEENEMRYKNFTSNITVSMGIGIADKENETLHQLIEKADLNLYKAKNSGKNKVIF